MIKSKKTYVAVVQKISSGKHGLYAVTTLEQNSDNIKGSVTFSLQPKVWKEKIPPENGHVVILTNLTKKNAGWRANKARFFQPSDNT